MPSHPWKYPKEKDLQSFLGMVNYLNRLSPYLANLRDPLQQLPHKANDFEWNIPHHDTFIWIKLGIFLVCTLSFYDPKEDTILQRDTSKKGLGAILNHNAKPVNYTSCPLTL